MIPVTERWNTISGYVHGEPEIYLTNYMHDVHIIPEDMNEVTGGKRKAAAGMGKTAPSGD